MKGLIGIVGDAAVKMASKAKIKVIKASPEILIFGGAACIVAATVMACKATKKADDILEEAKEDLENLNSDEEISEALVVSEKRRIKLRTAGELLRVYGPSAALGAAGLAMIFTSHGIMKKRNGALLAAYNALDAAFRQYRERVRSEDDGKERDRRYLTGKTDRERQLMEDIEEEAMIISGNRSPLGPYVFEFSKDTSIYWSAHSFTNLNRIREAEKWGTRQLEHNGFLFLNEMLRELGIDPVPWGQLIGWCRGYGDSQFVTILSEEDSDRLEYDSRNEEYGNPIMLEFNCDGLVWEML